MKKFKNISLQLKIEVRDKETEPADVHSLEIWAPTAVAILVALAGWYLVERFARKREKRADLRELSKAFAGSVDDIVLTASGFYRLNGADPRSFALAASLRAKLSDLPKILNTFADAGMQFDATSQMKRFRQAVTGNDFDSLARTATEPNGQIYNVIAGAAQDLVRQVNFSIFNKLLGTKHFQN